ncbi:amidase [Halorussus sp. AFM4]|uniref:amidase n=1 Tax=Halorussus sp. AFM4 TaxID=3421651 RepID=UPI003EBF8C97
MTPPDDDADVDFGPAPDGLGDEDVAEYAAAVRDLPEYEPETRFGPATPTDREDPYNAYVTPFAAESADEGPLSHLDVAVKDNLAVRGVPMTAGTDEIAFRPDEDATAVARLWAAGATLTGTTNMDALAFGTTGETSAHGRTENPTAAGRVPGGSSSGSAAAVAGGLVDAALGTDTGGSVRIPASFCGVVGFKPTYGLVSRHGLAPLAPSLDHVGAIAGDVATATRVVEAVAGADPADHSTLRAPAPDAVDLTSDLATPPADLALGVVEESVDAATGDVAAAVEDAVVEVAAARDWTVETVSLPDFDAATLVNDALTVMEFAGLVSSDGHLPGAGGWYDGAWADAVREFRERGLPANDRVRRALHLGRRLRREDGSYVRASEARRRFAERVAAAFGQVDALVAPTTPMVAPELGDVPESVDVLDTLRNTAPFDNSGQPSVSVPCGRADGCPVGLQVTTLAGADALAARVARAVEEATGT